MDYTLLEDAYPEGGDFKSRTTVKEGKGEGPPPAQRPATGASKAVESLKGVLPLDTDTSTSNFGEAGQPVYMYPAVSKTRPTGQSVQEAFTTQSAGDDMKMKMDKILAMVEQNKTGYEPNSHHDMFLYILTGVMFLFTFDTFVMLGKTMRV